MTNQPDSAGDPTPSADPSGAADRDGVQRDAVERATPAKHEPAKHEPAKHEARVVHHRVSSALIGALLALLGFALAIQLRSSSHDDGLAGARQDDLVRILNDQDNQEQRLRQQVADLQSAQQRLESGGDPSAAAAEASAQAQALGILTGTLPATGPGVQVTIDDPLNGLHAEDLLDVIAELRGAGAEAIQIDTVRIGVSSAFQDAADGAVVADGTRLAQPYTVLAIGDPKTLDTALTIPGGVASTVQTAGGTITISQQTVAIHAVRPITTPSYASPAGS